MKQTVDAIMRLAESFGREVRFTPDGRVIPQDAKLRAAITAALSKAREDEREKLAKRLEERAEAFGTNIRTALHREALELRMTRAENAATASCAVWTPMHKQDPPVGTECAVVVRYSLDSPAFVCVDTWDIQVEDLLEQGGPTIETGVGWNDNDENDVIAWMPLPPLPPADWDQRLPDPLQTLTDDAQALGIECPRQAGEKQ